MSVKAGGRDTRSEVLAELCNLLSSIVRARFECAVSSLAADDCNETTGGHITVLGSRRFVNETEDADRGGELSLSVLSVPLCPSEPWVFGCD